MAACELAELGSLFAETLRATTSANFTVETFADEADSDAPDVPLDNRRRIAFGARFETRRPESFHQVFAAFEARDCAKCGRFAPSAPETLDVGLGGTGAVITFASPRFRVRLGNSELLGEGDPPQTVDLLRLGERLFEALVRRCP